MLNYILVILGEMCIRDSTGDDEGVHWRETTGWFSYRMKTNGKPVHKVRILFRPEIRKDAKVWINGQEVGKLADKPASDLSVGIVDVPVSCLLYTS